MPPKRWVLPLLLVTVICAFFHEALLGRRFFAIDFFETFVPLRSILAEAWSHGFPFWTGRLGNGAPVFASPAYGVLYLPNLLYLGTDPSRALTVLTVLHFVAGGLGTWFLARRWEMSRAAAWTAAVAFALGGPAVSSTAYPNLSLPLAWLPWALVAHETAASGPAWRGVAGLALVWFSMFAAGDPVVLAAAIAGSGLIALRDAVAVGTGRTWRKRLTRAIAPPAAAGLAALILASPLLLAIVRYFPQSVRGAGFKAAGIVQFSLHPLLLAGAILPDPFGNPNVYGPGGFWASALALDRGRPLLAGLYVGGLMVALAVLGALRRSPQRAIVLTWLGLLALLALGKYGPIYPLAGDTGGFDALRYPAKWIVPAMLPLALLIGTGLDRLGESAETGGPSKRGAVVLLVALSLLGAASVGSITGLERKLAQLAATPDLHRVGGLTFEQYVRTTWLSGAARSAAPLMLALVALVFGARAKRLFPLVPVVAALATFDVALANRHLAPTAPSDFYDVPVAAKAILADAAGHGRVYVENYEIEGQPLNYLRPPESAEEAARPFRESLLAYVGASVGLSLTFNWDIEAFSPLAYARAGVLMKSAPLRERLMFLGAAGATHIVTVRPADGTLLRPMAVVPHLFDRPLLVCRNPFALPRARIVPRLTPYDSDAGFIHAVQSGPDDLFAHTAMVDEQELRAAAPPAGAPPAEGGKATILEESGRSLAVQVEGPGGYLVVSDTIAPGWTARVDGRPAPLLRADLAFRAVPVPAGTHRVEMLYTPW